MRYGVYRETEALVEIVKKNANEVEIIKTNLQDGTEQSIVLTKQQLYKIDRFLKLGIHHD